MESEVEARISEWMNGSAVATVRIELTEGGTSVGGISLNHIYVRNQNGKPHITFPLTKQMRPTAYLRGRLKQQVYDAVWDAFCNGRKLDPATYKNERDEAI